MPDLVTSDYVLACLPGLTVAQQMLLPGTPNVISAASRLARKYCNRYFTRRTAIDELYAVGPNQVLLLNEYPVNSVSRIATNPQTVLSVWNTDNATNQRAVAALITSGNFDTGLVPIGLTATRWASGSLIPNTYTFGPTDTIAAVAAGITAFGGGWTATAASGYGLWPAADLRAVQGAMPALGSSRAEFKIHTSDLYLPLDAIDCETGVVVLGRGSSNPITGPQWGPMVSTSLGDLQVSGGLNSVRVVYDAGLDTVPEEIQQAVVEIVWEMICRLLTDPTLLSESDGAYKWEQMTNPRAIPMSAQMKLDLYKNRKATALFA